MEVTTFNTAFKSSNETVLTQTVQVHRRVSADVSMSRESVGIILLGAAHFQALPMKLSYVLMLEEMSNLIIAIDEQPQEQDIIVPVDEARMMVFRSFVEGYLSYQEALRASTSPGFNPDKYILAKMLLLDIREWQAGVYVVE